MFWLFIWILIVIVVFGTFFWSISTLMKQKRAWKAFADKYKLTYTAKKFLQSPSLEGVISGYKLLVFSDDRPTTDTRGKRFITVVQIALPSGMPTSGAIAATTFADLVGLLNLSHNIKITHEGWDYTLIAQAKEANLLEDFLSSERLKALDGLARVKNCSLLYVFDRQETYLRLETPEALEQPAKLDAIVKKLIAAGNVLSTTAKEKPAS